MNWTRDRSLLLSQCCVGLFALLLLLLDLGAYRVAVWYVAHRLYHFQFGAALMVSIYLGSLFAWPCLFRLWHLLGNLKRGEVFAAVNVRHMRHISWCCAGVAGVCALSACYYGAFCVLAVAAGFMALLVRVLKNVFQEAARMKDELDLTV